MAYRDPYTNQNQFDSQPSYNPYEDLQPHAPYEHAPYEHAPYEPAGAPPGGEYRDEPFALPTTQTRPYSATRTPGFEKAGGFVGPPTRQSAAWDDRVPEGLWTRGSRVSCIGRFCGCFLCSFLFVLVSIILALALFIRPPNVVINGVIPPKTGSEVQVTSDPALEVNMLVNISVNNPNYFGVTFKTIDLDIKYPINNTDFGGGNASNIVFPANTKREFDFPFSIKYKPADDPTHKILLDLATKCGVLTNATRTDLTIDYKIDLGLDILGVTIHPSVSNSLQFECPNVQAQLEQVLKAAGIDLNTILGGL